jgi:hypothetical protein
VTGEFWIAQIFSRAVTGGPRDEIKTDPLVRGTFLGV